ncbi:MAG TPA: dephospho-CoA kinase, partial [Methylibium sp.]
MQTRIGLTGGIGSGKSVVATMLADLGACLVDTDAIARQITAPGGAAIPALLAQFGAVIIDAHGGLDRERMRTLAFTRPETRRLLESLLHPLIGQEAEHQAASA